jgi:hypothetical protein
MKRRIVLELSEIEDAVLTRLCELYNITPDVFVVESLKIVAHLQRTYQPEDRSEMAVEIIRSVKKAGLVERDLSNCIKDFENLNNVLRSVLPDTHALPH